MLNMLSPLCSPWMPQHKEKLLNKIRTFAATNITLVCTADDLSHITDVGRDNRKVAGHGLLHDCR